MGIAVVDGVPAASKATGIPQSTIYEWSESPEFVELRKRTKDQVAEEWWAIVQQGFRKTSELLGGTTDPQKAAVATAIIADKMLLIRGDATARSEVSTFNGRNDHERSALASLLREAVAGSGESDGAEAVPGDVPVEEPSPT